MPCINRRVVWDVSVNISGSHSLCVRRGRGIVNPAAACPIASQNSA